MPEATVSRHVLIVSDLSRADWSETERAIERLSTDRDGGRTREALDYEIEKIRQIQSEGWELPRLFNAWESLAGPLPVNADEMTLEMTRVILRSDLERVQRALASEPGGIFEGRDCEGVLQKRALTGPHSDAAASGAILEMEMDLKTGEAPIDGLYDALRRLSQFRVVCGSGITLLYEI